MSNRTLGLLLRRGTLFVGVSIAMIYCANPAYEQFNRPAKQAPAEQVIQTPAPVVEPSATPAPVSKPKPVVKVTPKPVKTQAPVSKPAPVKAVPAVEKPAPVVEQAPVVVQPSLGPCGGKPTTATPAGTEWQCLLQAGYESYRWVQVAS